MDDRRHGDTSPLESLSESRQALLMALKMGGPATIADLAGRTSATGEAVRQQLLHLQREGWVTREARRKPQGDKGGRPPTLYALTSAGEHLFPKKYDDLAVAMIDAVAGQLGPEAVRAVLAEVANKKVAEWRPHVQGRSVGDSLLALRDIYQPGDPYVRVERAPGGFRLIEHNCPFWGVAMRRPALCSVTVNALTRLLGVRVVREERFQDGAGRCVFRIYEEQPVEVSGFESEPDRSS